MSKKEIKYTECLKETIEALQGNGLLLACVDSQGKPNAMTIGWGTIGVVWGKPIFVVLVRFSRYTYELIEKTGDFTVNVPDSKMKNILSYCGSVSGRNADKFTEKKLTAVKSKTVKSPIIEECPINFECKVVHKNDVVPKTLAQEIMPSYYGSGDFHRVFFGEILYTHKD